MRVFTLTNARGMRVRVLDYGGAIIELTAPDRAGRYANAVLALPDLATLEANASTNTLIGRYANRIGGGFALDGIRYTPPANAQGVTLHGGSDGYNKRVWRATSGAVPGGVFVELTLVSPDGDQGFPGRLSVTVRYTLEDGDALRIDTRATADKPTVAAFTNHAYFNLAGGGSIEGHRLQIFADRYTPTDANQIPTGELADVTGTPFDFRQPTAVGARLRDPHPQLKIGRGYDHNWMLRNTTGALTLAARLHHPASGRLLEISTTEPGLQVYSGNHLNGSLVNADGATVRQTDAIALETQQFPDSPNKPHFPSTMLRPGETLRSTTVFRFTVADR